LKRAIDAGVPAQWVAGDTVYGGDRQLRAWLESEKRDFVVAVPVSEVLPFDRGEGVEQSEPVRLPPLSLMSGDGLVQEKELKVHDYMTGRGNHWIVKNKTLIGSTG
jgi:SRSO17 transposase